MEHFGIWSLLPAVCALSLAIASKRVVPSLLVGILIGTIMVDTRVNGFFHSILFSIVNLFGAIAGHPANAEEGIYGMGLVKGSGRAELVIIVFLLGAFIGVLNKSGGAYAFGQWIVKKVSSKESAQVSTAAMGSALFTSAYFSSLATGTVFRPIYDRLQISRAKLAFFLDSTSAPINVLVPISGWVAFMGALMVDNIASVDDPIAGLAQTIPYNFYNIIILILVYLLASGRLKDWGPMKKAELRAQRNEEVHREEEAATGEAAQQTEGVGEHKNGSVSDMLLPLGTSIVVLVLLGVWSYTLPYFFAVPELPFGGNIMLIVSFSLGIIVAFIKYMAKKLMTPGEFSTELFEGVKDVILGAVIIILAVTLGDVMRAAAPEGTGAAIFIEQTVGGEIPAFIIPVSVFIISAFISFSMGTSFGTWAIMMPIGISLMAAADGNLMLVTAAILSGGAFGDHTSPISDTSLMSSIGAGSDHMEHINTQLPYALTAAGIAAVCFLVAGLIF